MEKSKKTMWKFRLYAAIGDTYFVMQKMSKNWKNIENWPKQKKNYFDRVVGYKQIEWCENGLHLVCMCFAYVHTKRPIDRLELYLRWREVSVSVCVFASYDKRSNLFRFVHVSPIEMYAYYVGDVEIFSRQMQRFDLCYGNEHLTKREENDKRRAGE